MAIKISDEYIKQKEEINELKAMVNNLTKAGNLMKCNLGYSDELFSGGYISLWKKALDKSPAQCLVEVKADAVSEAVSKFRYDFEGDRSTDSIEAFFFEIESDLRKSMIVTKPSISLDELSDKIDKEFKDDGN